MPATSPAARNAAHPDEHQLPKDAAKLHPSVELVLLGCALLLVYGVSSPLIPLLLLIAAASTALFSARIGFARWLLIFAALTGPMLIMVGLIQGFFYPGEGTPLWDFGPATVTAEGITVALQLWLRVAAMVGLCVLFAAGSDASRLFDALIGLRLPLTLATVCATALSLMPLLRTSTAEAMTARAARGWDTRRLSTRLQVLPGVLASLVTISLVQLDQRQDALAQRGMGTVPRPGPGRRYAQGTAQRVLLIGAPLLTLVLVSASLLGWLPLPSAADLVLLLTGESLV